MFSACLYMYTQYMHTYILVRMYNLYAIVLILVTVSAQFHVHCTVHVCGKCDFTDYKIDAGIIMVKRDQTYVFMRFQFHLYSRGLKCPLHIASYALRIGVSDTDAEF